VSAIQRGGREGRKRESEREREKLANSVKCSLHKRKTLFSEQAEKYLTFNSKHHDLYTYVHYQLLGICPILTL
jgi:hypothetical protein